MSGGGSLERRARRLAATIRGAFDGEVRRVDVRCWSCGAVVARITRFPSGSLVAGDALAALGPHAHPWQAPEAEAVDKAFNSTDATRASLRSKRP